MYIYRQKDIKIGDTRDNSCILLLIILSHHLWIILCTLLATLANKHASSHLCHAIPCVKSYVKSSLLLLLLLYTRLKGL